MRKDMTIFYEVHDGIYVNLTNKCPCRCTFCLRKNRDHMEESNSLWLLRTPSIDDVLEAMSKLDMNKYKEVVFCGFGEPTEAFEVLKETAGVIKEKYNKPVRINTNGLGNLINGRDITPELEGIVDTVSISLNTPNKEEYLDIVRPEFGPESYEAMIEFAKAAAKHVPNVIMTTVSTTITPEEEKQCADICKRVGAKYRIRPYEE